MQKYNNVANHMNFIVALMNVISLMMIVFFATKEPSIDTIIPILVFVILLILNNFTYLLLIDQWYFTYYNNEVVLQKWFNKSKRIDFEEVKYLYFVGNLVILSKNRFNIIADTINMKVRRQIRRTLKNEICIVINPYDQVFPKILLANCENAKKIEFKVKEKKYRELFELD
jgi:hypothetical protein